MKYLDNIISKPIFVDWAITSKCHLSCTHCRYRGIKVESSEERGDRRKELTTNGAIELASEINELNPNWILIEGGEPFLRKDLFTILEIFRPRINTNKLELKKKNNRSNPSNPWLQKRPIYIISSGIGFTEKYAQECKKLDVKLMISLDSANKKTYEQIRQGADYDEMVDAISIAQEYGILDSINVTLQELNCSIREIKAIGQFSHILNINKINFLGFKPSHRALSFKELPKSSDLVKVFSEILNINKKYGLGVFVDEPFFIPWLKKQKIYEPRMDTDKHGFGKKSNQLNPSNQWLQNDGPIVVENKSGCIFGEYLFIEPDETAKPCSFSPLSFKQIGKKTMQRIQNKRNRKGKCSKCKYVLECGGCRVRTYALTNDWLESDPLCPL